MPEAINLPGYKANYVAFMSTSLAARTVAGITVPSSPLITAALDHARNHLEDSLYNHVVRSWVLGTTIANRIACLRNCDRELLSISLILHDMGRERVLSSGGESLEFHSANAAHDFVEREGSTSEWDLSRKQLLWNSIALHTCASSAVNRQAEVIAAVLGIVADFGGPHSTPGNVLTTTEWQNLAREFPRAGLKDETVQELCSFCRGKVDTFYDTLFGDFGEELVEGYSRIGHRWYDYIKNPVDAE